MAINSPADPGPESAYGSSGTSGRGRGALWIAGLGLILVMGAAFALSYDGLFATAIAGGVRPSLAFLYPMIFDGFLVVTFAAALVLRSVGLRATWYPWLLIVVLLLAASGANVLHALGRESLLPPATTKMIVAAVPPVALGLAFPVWLLMFAYVRGGRRTRPRDSHADAPTDAESGDIVPGLRGSNMREDTRGAPPGPDDHAGTRARRQRPAQPDEPDEPDEPAQPDEPTASDEEPTDVPERVPGSGLPFRRRPALNPPPPSTTPPSGQVRSSPTPPDA